MEAASWKVGRMMMGLVVDIGTGDGGVVVPGKAETGGEAESLRSVDASLSVSLSDMIVSCDEDGVSRLVVMYLIMTLHWLVVSLVSAQFLSLTLCAGRESQASRTVS